MDMLAQLYICHLVGMMPTEMVAWDIDDCTNERMTSCMGCYEYIEPAILSLNVIMIMLMPVHTTSVGHFKTPLLLQCSTFVYVAASRLPAPPHQLPRAQPASESQASGRPG